MTALSLEMMQNELIRDVLRIDDMGVLKKVRNLLRREERKAAAEAPEPCMTKDEILANFDQACKELKLNLEGKLEFKTLEEALNEL